MGDVFTVNCLMTSWTYCTSKSGIGAGQRGSFGKKEIENWTQRKLNEEEYLFRLTFRLKDE